MQGSNRRTLLLAFFDWFLSARLKAAPNDELRRARVLVGASLLMQATMGALTVYSFRQGLPSAWTTLLATAVWAALLPFLRLGYDRLAGIWISSYALLSMLFVILHRDSTFELFDPWQGVLIMMALYLVGTWFGVVALGLVIAEAIALPLLAENGLLLETPYLANHASSGAAALIPFVVLFAFGWLYTSAQNGAKRALVDALRILSESREEYQLIAEGTDALAFTYDLNERLFLYVGPQAERIFGWNPGEWLVPGFFDRILSGEDASRIRNDLGKTPVGQRVQLECKATASDGRPLVMRLIGIVRAKFGARTLTGLMLDITELRRMESELRQVQKLESVGRLAAGVAHGINTPVQFVSDSLDFLREANEELLGLIRTQRTLLRSTVDGAPASLVLAEAEKAEESADLPYLIEHMPKAFERATNGLERVATIVRSMKEFAHPDAREKADVDLNRSIESTLTIARHEYRLIADIETHFGELPPVRCFAGEINQAILNLIVNASHAIEDVVKANGGRGRITITTRRELENIFIAIEDTGGGIPENIRERIFDPFFTTKGVGRGTGQGLAVARSVIVDKHKGELSFVTKSGKGTTFVIRLPLSQAVAALAG